MPLLLRYQMDWLQKYSIIFNSAHHQVQPKNTIVSNYEAGREESPGPESQPELPHKIITSNIFLKIKNVWCLHS